MQQQSLLKKLEVASWELGLSDLPLELEAEVSRTLAAESAIHGPLQLSLRLSFRRLMPLKLDRFLAFGGELRAHHKTSVAAAVNATPKKTQKKTPE